MDMLWWHWVVVGLVLAGLELLTPGGFFVIFFGAGALIVGVLVLLGAGGPLWMQWLLFTALSLAAVLFLRRPLQHWLQSTMGGGRDVDSILGELAVPLGDIPVGQVGRAELRGSAWSARNVGTTDLARGQRCTVVRVDGLTIFISPELPRTAFPEG
jgi:membrane protein implicated in regulation of membrane protease activity